MRSPPGAAICGRIAAIDVGIDGISAGAAEIGVVSAGSCGGITEICDGVIAICAEVIAICADVIEICAGIVCR